MAPGRDALAKQNDRPRRDSVHDAGKGGAEGAPGVGEDFHGGRVAVVGEQFQRGDRGARAQSAGLDRPGE